MLARAAASTLQSKRERSRAELLDLTALGGAFAMTREGALPEAVMRLTKQFAETK